MHSSALASFVIRRVGSFDCSFSAGDTVEADAEEGCDVVAVVCGGVGAGAATEGIYTTQIVYK